MPGGAESEMPLSRRVCAARELRVLARRADTSPGEVIAMLGGVVDFDCASLHRWDPVVGQHATLAAVGYPTLALAAVDESQHTDPSFPVARGAARPLLLGDIPAAGRDGAIYQEIIEPLGFRGGMTQCLFARDGRYVGLLNASTTSCHDPDDDVVALLDLLADDLAAVLDPLPVPVPATRALETGTSQGLLVTSGAVRTLTPGARGELTASHSPVRPLINGILRGLAGGCSLLVLHRNDLMAVRLDGGPNGVVVLHHAASAPCGLTVRELEVLDGLSHGHTNLALARRLHVTPRTVATHIEHILIKTGVPNRTAAARLAAQWGLLVWTHEHRMHR